MPADVPTALSRRRLLQGALLVGVAGTGAGLAGCTGSPASAPPSREETARRSAAATESGLQRQATAVAKANPGVAAAAMDAAAAHAAHAAALLDGLPTPSPAATATPSAGSAAPVVATPAALARAQDAAATAHLVALRPLDGPTARLLASVGASDAAFAAVIRQTAR